MAEKMCEVVKNDKVWKQVGTGTNTVTSLDLSIYEDLFVIVNNPSWTLNFTRCVPIAILSSTEKNIGYDGGYSSLGETSTRVNASLTTVSAIGKVNGQNVYDLAITVYAR